MASRSGDERRYYSIGEVSKMTGLEPYVLRFWEKEFPTLKPRKNSGGNRLYTLEDVNVINQINHLRTKEKLTIDGARAKLSLRKGGEQRELETAATIKTLIGRMRADIEDLLLRLNSKER